VSKVLHGIAAVVNVGTQDKPKLVTVDQSTDLSELDAKTMKALEAANALIDPEKGSAEQNDLASQAQGTVITPSSTVLQIAAYIESGDDGTPLNAAQTVALAGDDPAQARKVLEAEALAQGGDSRSTVTGALEKIATGGGSGN
jgi:hypothetical protein